MSIASDVSRIKSARSAIITAINNKGGTVSSAAKIDQLAPAINNIPAGGCSHTTYSGPYTVTPGTTAQTLATSGKLMNNDVIVEAASGSAQGFKMETGTVSLLGSTWTLNLEFVPQVVNLNIKRNNQNKRFVVGYCADRGSACWQSNDSGGIHNLTTATVSGNSITFNFKTSAGNVMNVTDILWSAAGYTA